MHIPTCQGIGSHLWRLTSPQDLQLTSQGAREPVPWFQSESGGLRTRRADCTVPGNACRFKTQEGPVLSVQVQSQENKIELESQFKAVRQEEFPLTL